MLLSLTLLRKLTFALIFLLVGGVLATPSTFHASAESLPEYCSEEDGEVICTIDILPFAEPQAYSPKVAEIPVGAKVVFVNTGPEIHTSTSTDATEDDASSTPNGVFDTGILAPDEKSESIVMDQEGTFRYYCAVHPDMRATLVVGSGGDESSTTDSSMKKTSSKKSLGFSSHDAQGNSLSGGELPITKISSVGDDAFMVDGTTPKGGSDAFSYDGSGHKKVPNGQVEINLDPKSNKGSILAEWTDPDGNDWRLEQTKFGGGNELYPGELVDGKLQYDLDADPVAINHYEHGTTGAGPPVEPTLFVYLASWGPAEVWKNGKSQGTFETHMMVTDAARNPETGKIVKSDETTPYSPMTPGDSKVNKHTAQLHLVYHTPAGDPTNNFPPPFEVFEHLMFYDIDVLQPKVHKTVMGEKGIADLPPLKQVKHEIAPADVTCASGMELVKKKSDGSPACVFPDSIDKLVSIGWADFF